MTTDKMTKHDKLLVGAVQTIIEAYNDSFSPSLIRKTMLLTAPYYDIRHSDKGYYLVASNEEDLSNPYILTESDSICDFTEQVFSELKDKGNEITVKWSDISKSDAVLDAVQGYFDLPETSITRIELSNDGVDQYLDRYGQPIQTVWLKVNHSRIIETFKTLEDSGFTYFDRNFWYIEL